MSGVNKSDGEGQERNHHVISCYQTIVKEKVAPSEKVKPSEQVEKVTQTLDDTEEPVVTIHRKHLNNFQGQYKGSTGWFNIDREWLK